ncbi:Ubiquitin carboxyl-terminal hydrolase MINDY-2 [Branchiostoma belcheri]|nr:Ubiquitin carboxyl-terminal hydrolase MINDY-2 [Branchiostoma belcheri]
MTWKVQLPPGTEVVTSDQLMDYLGDCILSSAPKNCTEGQLLNYEQNFHDAMSVFHKLQTGLDVNVKFTGVRHFEYTPECIVFDLLGIALYHGWLIDPQNLDIVTAVGNCSYNQLVEKIISSKSAQDSEVVSQGMMAEAYLESTASQLTYHGLAELSGTVKEGEFCVFFRNNHFSTMYKHKSELFLLVTDQGFLGEPNVVWETLSNVEGDSTFVDADFRTTVPNHGGSAQVPLSSQQQIDQVLKTVVSSLGDSFRTLARYAPLPQQSKQQMDQDYLVALTLQQEAAQDGEQQPAAMSDLELAKKLQEEEDARAQQLHLHNLNLRPPLNHLSRSPQGGNPLLHPRRKRCKHRPEIGTGRGQNKPVAGTPAALHFKNHILKNFGLLQNPEVGRGAVRPNCVAVMPSCVVCKNYNSKTKGQGISYHKFPQDEGRLQKWLTAVEPYLRAPWTIERIRQFNNQPTRPQVCSEHFSSSCCVDNPRTKLVAYKVPPKVLLEDAVPTIFGEKKSGETPDRQSEKLTGKQLMQETEQPLDPQLSEPCSTYELQPGPISTPETQSGPISTPETQSGPISTPEARTGPITTPETMIGPISRPKTQTGVTGPISMPETQTRPSSMLTAQFEPSSRLEIQTGPVIKRLKPQARPISTTPEPQTGPISYLDQKSEPIRTPESQTGPINIIVQQSEPIKTPEPQAGPISKLKPQTETICKPKPLPGPTNSLDHQSEPIRILQTQNEPIRTLEPQPMDTNSDCVLFPVGPKISVLAIKMDRPTPQPADTAKPFQCQHCDFTTVEKKDLDAHTVQHVFNKAFKCSICGHLAAFRSALKKHMFVHTREKPYKCNHCEYSAVSKRDLELHTSHQHTGEKQYKCGLCDYSTVRKHNLNTHMSQHVSEKPYMCGECGFRTNYKHSLEKHMNVHICNLEKPHTCRQCSYGSWSKKNLQRHVRVQHAKK